MEMGDVPEKWNSGQGFRKAIWHLVEGAFPMEKGKLEQVSTEIMEGRGKGIVSHIQGQKIGGIGLGAAALPRRVKANQCFG